eukprot:CAMPEP_0171722552 /NCGR_PEP_ID=MMETSP0991-20121206/23090_1 /TAXON_ID=483369 /ORGANISM="non described non described, Strain CCMP2098" /LENGTH=31 /DNA_ID= /DNA_START= /DNA_END= /DNA_ORIENTATION=
MLHDAPRCSTMLRGDPRINAPSRNTKLVDGE